jgi:hypothetical protein
MQQLDERRRPDTPEKRLLLAILADAISCLQKYGSIRNHRGRRVVHEAELWLMSTDRKWPFSFENICDVLGIDSEYVRTGLRQEVKSTDAAA